jgi:hypothetical protein
MRTVNEKMMKLSEIFFLDCLWLFYEQIQQAGVWLFTTDGGFVITG